jgi:ABC-type transport system involved in multi-copper enzyme maturation permease subunit
VSTASAAPATLELGGSDPVPFSRVVAVELRKSYDTRAGFWLLLSIGGVVALVLGIFTTIILVQDEPVVFGDWVGIAAYLTSVLLPILAIMLVTTEWTQRTALVTFTLEPHRERVFAAKLVVGVLLTLLTLVFAFALGLVCNVLCEIGNPDLTGWEIRATDLAGFLVTQTLAMMGGFALAMLLLNTPAAIVLFFVYRFVLPGIFAVLTGLIDGFDKVAVWLDFQAAQGDIYEWELSGAAEWGHLLVSGFIWLAVPMGIGLWRILRAEVK